MLCNADGYHLELTPTSTTSFTVPSYRYTREEKIPRLLHTSEMFMLPEVMRDLYPNPPGPGAARDEVGTNYPEGVSDIGNEEECRGR